MIKRSKARPLSVRRWMLGLALLATIGIIVGCGGGGPQPTLPPSNHLTLNENVTVLPTDGSVAANQVDDSHVTLTGQQIPTVKVGDVIVSSEGQGMLVKAVSVTQTAQGTELEVQPATLEDAIKEASVSLEVPIKQSDIAGVTTEDGVTYDVTAAEGGSRADAAAKVKFTVPVFELMDMDGNPATTHDKLWVACEVTVKPKLYLEFDAPLGEGINQAEFGIKLDLETDWTLKTGIELGRDRKNYLRGLSIQKKEKVFGKIQLAPITVMCGLLPVVVTNEIEVVGGVEYKFDWDSMPHVVVNSTGKLGVRAVNNGGWTIEPVCSFTVDPRLEMGFVSFESMLKPYAGLRFNSLIYGCAGPWVQGDAYFKGELSGILDPPTVNADVSFGLEVIGGFKGRILSWELFEIQIPQRIDFKLWSDSWRYSFLDSGADVTVRHGDSAQKPLGRVFLPAGTLSAVQSTY